MLENFARLCIRQRKIIVALIFIATVSLAYFASQIVVKTIFEDLQPTSHPYVKINDKFKKTFGGINVVTFVLEARKGDIFQMPVLRKIKELTKGIAKIDAVNEFQIYSIAGKKLKEVRATAEGIGSTPYMWPDLPKNQKEINDLRTSILRSPLVYGPYVSKDLKATLLTMDFYDGLLDYKHVYKEVYALVKKVNDENVKISVVGNPLLSGWVHHYLPETTHLVMVALLIFLFFLFIINRTWRGTILPLLSGAVSAIWALGVSELLGINFDPLVVVVAMLITARAVSHSVQMITRFHEEIDNTPDGEEPCSREAATKSLQNLLKPGLLGIATDAGCVAVVAISPIPLLQKLVLLAIVWISTLAVSAVILTPVLLSWVRRPRAYAHGLNLDLLLIRPFLSLCVRIVASKFRYVSIGVGIALFFVCGFYSLNLKIGDSHPGSPILWPNAQYNFDSATINKKFPGADQMFVVIGGDHSNQTKDIKVLDIIARYQRYMESQKEIGGSLSLADILPAVNMTLHEGNFRYAELGGTSQMNSELMFMFENASEPGDLARFVDVPRSNAGVMLNFSDRQGDTIRTAIARTKKFIRDNPEVDKLAKIHLAGGTIGVIAAVNEVILSSQIQSIALALFILVMMCIVVYRSSIAGIFFLVPVVLSNLVTFAFMAWDNIAMNINTVPVAALGIGLGVDYTLYICDRIKVEYELGRDPLDAIHTSLHCAGRGVLVTAVVLVASVLVWLFSSLRFQAEMGMLIGLWLMVSAMSALFLMPSMVYVFKPKFIFGDLNNKLAVKRSQFKLSEA